MGMAPPPPGEESIIDIVGLKTNKIWTRHLEFEPHRYTDELASSSDSSTDDDSNDESEVPEKSSEKSSENPKKALFGSELSPDSDAPPKPWEVKKPENVLRNPNPPKGIFANVDFDRLNSKKVTAPKPVIKPTVVEEVKRTSERYI